LKLIVNWNWSVRLEVKLDHAGPPYLIRQPYQNGCKEVNVSGAEVFPNGELLLEKAAQALESGSGFLIQEGMHAHTRTFEHRCSRWRTTLTSRVSLPDPCGWKPVCLLLRWNPAFPRR
jgi:hypothetical protein